MSLSQLPSQWLLENDDLFFKIYEAKQAKLNAEIERKRQEQQTKFNFMEKLRCIAFPCYEKKPLEEKELNISAPNIFTPNNDGINDSFIVLTKAEITAYKMTITNKKGEVLFTTQSMNKPWQGRKVNSKKILSDGFYFWAVEITDRNNKEAKFNGTVQLKTDNMPSSKEEIVENINYNSTFNFISVESKPEFTGGAGAMMQYIANNVNYPKEAVEKEISGKVFVQFIISEEGKITTPAIIKSVHPLLDKEAITVIKNMPNWSPGMQRGQKVKVRYTIPVNFKLK